jgi:hypothetical protein
MMFAMHHMGDIEDQQIRDSIYTNTTLKFVSHTSADIHNLCRNMGKTETDFITTLKQFEFAYFGPNMEQAVKAKLPLVDFNQMPPMSETQYQQLLAFIKVRPTPPEPAPQKVSPPPSKEPELAKTAPTSSMPVSNKQTVPVTTTVQSGDQYVDALVNDVPVRLKIFGAGIFLTPQTAIEVGLPIQQDSYTKPLLAVFMLKTLRIKEP